MGDPIPVEMRCANCDRDRRYCGCDPACAALEQQLAECQRRRDDYYRCHRDAKNERDEARRERDEAHSEHADIRWHCENCCCPGSTRELATLRAAIATHNASMAAYDQSFGDIRRVLDLSPEAEHEDVMAAIATLRARAAKLETVVALARDLDDDPAWSGLRDEAREGLRAALAALDSAPAEGGGDG